MSRTGMKTGARTWARVLLVVMGLALICLGPWKAMAFEHNLDLPLCGELDVDLGIADQAWSNDRWQIYEDKGALYDVGWCGETSIQMAAARFGLDVSQLEVHNASAPPTPDIFYREDILRALEALGLGYEEWDASGSPEFEAFKAWVLDHLKNGFPVLAGTMTREYADEKPYYHYVLLTGYNAEGLCVNTNMIGRRLIPYSVLADSSSIYFFEVDEDEGDYLGIAVNGPVQ